MQYISEEPVPDHVFDHCFLASVQFIDQTMLYGQAVLSVTVREQGWLQRLASTTRNNMDSVPLLLRILRGTMIRDHFGPHLLGRFWFGLQDKSLLSSTVGRFLVLEKRRVLRPGPSQKKTPQAWGGNRRKKHHRRRKHPTDANNMAYRSKIHALRPGPSQQNTHHRCTKHLTSERRPV